VGELGDNPLTDANRQHLLDELGSPDAVEAAIRHGARSIDADGAQQQGYRYRGHRTGGLLLPFGGDFGQLRCDDPPVASNGDVVKYLNRAGVRQKPATFGGGNPTMATEGWKDALCLHLATGATVQALAGVSAHHLLATTVELLIYDADARDNPAVWSQLITAGLQRGSLRLSFFPAEIAGPKGGACEYFRAAGAHSFDSIERLKARELIRVLPGQWDRHLRADWQPQALRHLARLAAKAGFSRDAVGQLVAAAAKALGFPVEQARRIASAERRKLAPPPAPLPPDARPEARLVVAAGVPKEGTVNAGGWKASLSAGVGSRLRLNQLGHRVEFSGQELEAEREELLYVAAQEAGWKVNKADCYDGTRAAALDYAFHPVAEYLKEVSADPTIPPFDLDTVATRYLGVGDPLSAAMLRHLLIGAVARIFEPGCPPPGVVVLRGAQGIGKSEFWQALAGEFYVASRDGDDGKDQAMAMHRSWLYDLDELDKVTTARQAAGLRSIITAPADTFRLPYARRETTMPRRFVMVASVNGDGFLTDPEGNRRFWVIDCPQQKDSGDFIDGPGTKRDRDAIWKAAVLGYRAGEPWQLSPEQQAASNVRNGAWEAVDEWEAALAGWASRSCTPGGFTVREAISGAGLRQMDHISKADEMRAADALKRTGFSRSTEKIIRPDGSRNRTWGLAPAQPAQALPILSRKVGQAESAGGEGDLPFTAQPAQPFSRELEKGDIGVAIGGGGPIPLPPINVARLVGQVGQSSETASCAGGLEPPTPMGQPPPCWAAGQRPPVAEGPSAEGNGQPQTKTNTELVEAALAALRLAPAPSATGPVWEWLQARNAGVSKPQVRATLERLQEEEREVEPQLGLEVPA